MTTCCVCSTSPNDLISGKKFAVTAWCNGVAPTDVPTADPTRDPASVFLLLHKFWHLLGAYYCHRSNFAMDLNLLDQALVDLRQSIFGDWQLSNWLGTDAKGRDILSRIIWGSRTSILVAIAATLCSLIIGVSYGAVSGFFGGWVDNLMMRIVDVLYSIPFIFVVIFLITILNTPDPTQEEGGVNRELVFYVVIGAIYWLTMARVVRGQVLSLRETEFVEAARVIGASSKRISPGARRSSSPPTSLA